MTYKKISLLIVITSLFIWVEVTVVQGETSMENVKAIWSRYAEVTKGYSTYYGEYPGGGACALDPPSPLSKKPEWIMVAAGQYDYQKSLGCGMCIEITAKGEPTDPSTGGPTPMKGTYKATVWDLCGGCKQAGFDFYIQGYGEYKTSFKAVPCPTVTGQQDNIQFRFTGSNPWSIKLQARNSKIVTVGMEIEHNNKWVCMARTDDNYFTVNGLGEIKFPKRFRVTSISGEQLVSTLSEIKNDENIATDIQYSGFDPASKPESIKCYGQAGKSEQPIGPTSSTGGGASLPTSTGSTSTPASSTTKPAEEDKNFCKGKAPGHYADPKDCSSFYQCVHGITFRKQCPAGFLFNPQTKVCDHAANVECTAE